MKEYKNFVLVQWIINNSIKLLEDLVKLQADKNAEPNYQFTDYVGTSLQINQVLDVVMSTHDNFNVQCCITNVDKKLRSKDEYEAAFFKFHGLGHHYLNKFSPYDDDMLDAGFAELVTLFFGAALSHAFFGVETFSSAMYKDIAGTLLNIDELEKKAGEQKYTKEQVLEKCDEILTLFFDEFHLNKKLN